MAIDITGNPWTIKSTDVNAAALGAALFLQVWTGQVHIYNIEFMGYGSDGDTCLIQDNNNRVVWQGNGSLDLSTIRSGNLGWASQGGIGGIRIPLNGITDGSVRIYIK